ncbi:MULTISPECIES: DUF4160 domain-containing protein [unclassified Janthinobacterium]|uniref:DUF4160 domain-containing protein n=1 Tax=unclassified Janthinobacterium TaxID=2610881 RepID=UPI001607E676|nr:MULTISPECIES: DUF4160 domain-containing protein [unclassified Janthinobacterium]MBB5609188.1 hypothetical protein [Janthinobacterium sp. S3T4]MBB5614361.1 hypothetical protein [Janthinobacterium sp. S3M3]
MPTVLHIFGLRVVIYTNDHRPAHVHVMGNGGEAVFNLHCQQGPPELRENYGFPESVLKKIAAALAVNMMHLCIKWKEIHGHHSY